MFTFKDMRNGEKKQVFIDIKDGYKIPVTLIKGIKEGPTVCVTAGLHSGEYIGVEAVVRLSKEINASSVSGNIILIHCINTSGFLHKTISVVYEDLQNLNRNFPGDENGTISDDIKLFLERQLYPNIDYLFDLHSGARNEELTPCLFLPVLSDKEGVYEKAKELAFATNIPKVILSQNSKGFVGYAAKKGIPALLLERGGLAKMSEEDIQGFVDDVQLILEDLKMYEFDSDLKPCEKQVYTKNTYISSENTGLWYPKKRANELVKEGEVLGVITDFFGNEIQTVTAKHDAVIFYYLKDLSVKEGEDLYAYGAVE